MQHDDTKPTTADAYDREVGRYWNKEAAEAARERQDETIRELAERMARELDVHVDRAEAAARNLIRLGLIELKAAT